MAFDYIHFESNLQHGRLLRDALSKLEEGRGQLFEVRDCMIRMRDGNGSVASHYAQVTTRFAFPDDASSKAAFDEIASCCGKLEVNTSVTDVKNAMDQLFDKLRG